MASTDNLVAGTAVNIMGMFDHSGARFRLKMLKPRNSRRYCTGVSREAQANDDYDGLRQVPIIPCFSVASGGGNESNCEDHTL